MSSYQEKLNELLEASGEHNAGGFGAGLGIVGEVVIEFGWLAYARGHDYWSLFRAFSAGTEAEAARQSANDALEKLIEQHSLGKGEYSYARKGLRLTVKKDVLSRDEPYETDRSDWFPLIMWDRDLREQVNNPAAGLLMEAMAKLDVPIGSPFWGQIHLKDHPFYVSKGEDGKKDKDRDGNPRWPLIKIPARRFASKEEAQKFVKENQSSDTTNANHSGFSTKAQAYEDIEALAEEINKSLTDAIAGKPIRLSNHPFPERAETDTPTQWGEKAKQYVATVYQIETSDIDLLIPF